MLEQRRDPANGPVLPFCPMGTENVEHRGDAKHGLPGNQANGQGVCTVTSGIPFPSYSLEPCDSTDEVVGLLHTNRFLRSYAGARPEILRAFQSAGRTPSQQSLPSLDGRGIPCRSSAASSEIRTSACATSSRAPLFATTPRRPAWSAKRPPALGRRSPPPRRCRARMRADR